MTKKSSEKCGELYRYLSAQFSKEFATAITKYMNTDYTARKMLKYLEDTRKCSMEMIVDEMLAILNNRDTYVKKQIEKNRRIDVDELFIRSFDIQWNEDLQASYVYKIPAIANIDHFEFKSHITFFVGENGSGKSTLLEAIAVACGLNPEGGTANYRFSTYDDYSDLASAIRICKGPYRAKWSYFLRAESFYNVASVAMTKYNNDGKMPDLHARSHGESFLDFIQKADQPGFYIMDEPEATLSPQRQLTLLIHLVKMAQKGAQFVIVTHSPILLAIPAADIFSFDEEVFSGSGMRIQRVIRLQRCFWITGNIC